MLSTPRTQKLIWFFFVDSIFTYAVLCFILEQFVLNETDGGFIFENGEAVPSSILYGFVVAAVLALLVQYLVSQKMQTSMTKDLVRYACFESVGVLGFLLFLFGGNFREPLIFIAVAFVGILLTFPRSKAL